MNRNSSTANSEAVRAMSLTSLALVPKSKYSFYSEKHFSNILMGNNA